MVVAHCIRGALFNLLLCLLLLLDIEAWLGFGMWCYIFPSEVTYSLSISPFVILAVIDNDSQFLSFLSQLSENGDTLTLLFSISNLEYFLKEKFQHSIIQLPLSIGHIGKDG